MTLVQFASLWNLTAIGVVLGLSLLVRRRVPTASYFDTWSLSYACVFATIALELLATLVGRHGLLNGVEVAVVGANTALLLLTGARLPRPEPASPALWAVVGLAMLASLAALALGHPFPVASGPVLGGLAVAAVRLGRSLTRQPWTPAATGLRWLGWPLIAVGLVPLAFPLLGDTRLAWLGYWAAGVLHLIVGIGMGVAALEGVRAELRVANDELRDQQARLQDLDRMKSTFVGNVGHELRTPLASIKAAAWLSVHDPEARSVTFGETILAQADVLASLVDDLLIYSRIEAGEMSYNLDPVDVRQLVLEVVDGIEPLYARKGLTLVRTFPEVPVQALLDGPRIAQVLRNLLVNAHHFTPRGGRVEVWLEEEGDAVRLAVADSGVGIPAEHQAAIFERFHQVDATASRRVGGTGLGLAICRAIVEGHGGRIAVESTVGQGSTFRVVLPLEPGPTPPGASGEPGRG